MVTIYDIAKKCGVSASTVSKVVNNYSSIPEPTKEKVLKAMEELDYIPNNSAKFLSKGSSNNIGILSCFGTSITPFKHPFFMDIMNSFQNIMNQNKYDLVFISRTVGSRSGTFYKNCVSRNVDGVLMLGNMNHKEMKEVMQSEIPSVGFDYIGDLMSGVHSNNFELMYELTEHLISLGHKDIVYIMGDKNDITLSRLYGFKKALSNYGITYSNSMVIQSKYVDSEVVESIINELLEREEMPTAIMFPDDYSAAIGMKILKEKGYSCPKDISITGFDGVEIGNLIAPTLTTASQNSIKIGEILANKLIEKIKDNTVENSIIEVKGKIVVGESTSKPIR